MIELPKKLQNKSFRFIKIQSGKKVPSEKDWPMTNNYKYNDSDFVEYLKTARSYGVTCGFGKLAIIDCDNLESAERIMASLPNTFTVLSPGHKSPHLYFIINDLTEKIVMTDDTGIHHGEVQWVGAQVLGPGSLHPNGNKYAVLKNIEIKSITKQDLLTAIKPFTKAEKENPPNDSGVNMEISLVVKAMKALEDDGKELWGPHPMHGSDGGNNFRINEKTNRWHCFRCGTGGDAVALVAMLEGIVPCNQHVQGYWKSHKTEFKLALAIAKKKYGYKTLKEAEIEKQIELARPLTEAEIIELQNPKLIFNIVREIQREGVVGEEKSILALINRIVMRCVLNITKTSGNMIVLDDTGLGKDNVTGKLCNIMLVKSKTLFSATCISDKVLNYWHPGSETASWDGRVMYLQDPEEDTLKGQAFRIRASGDNENVTLDTERNLRYIQIIGKPILIVTSMKARVDIELVRRWDAVHLDPSAELTKAIVKHQLYEAALGKEFSCANENLRGALQNLPAVKVIIPFSADLLDLINSEAAVMRTVTLKLLDVIKASAALHQFQREKNESGCIVATKEDLAYAIFVSNYCNILSGQTLNRNKKH